MLANKLVLLWAVAVEEGMEVVVHMTLLQSHSNGWLLCHQCMWRLLSSPMCQVQNHTVDMCSLLQGNAQRPKTMTAL
jgi:hypothetical protein